MPYVSKAEAVVLPEKSTRNEVGGFSPASSPLAVTTGVRGFLRLEPLNVKAMTSSCFASVGGAKRALVTISSGTGSASSPVPV